MVKVSVLMGVYNCKNIEELSLSVESIIKQTLTEWEFIICDDGSNDGTLEKLHDIAKKDDRIKVISYEKNQGLAYALNFAFRNSKGQYVARQDADDISYPERLEKQVNFLDEHSEFDLVGTIADVYDEKGIWGEFLLKDIPEREDFLWNSPFLHPSIVMRRKSLEEAGCYRVSKETRRAEDYDLFMRMYAREMRGYNIQEKLYKYKIVNGYKKYRRMEDRIEEAVVRYKGFRQLRILWKGIPYIIKPIAIGMIPQRIFRNIKSSTYNKKDEVHNSERI